MLAELKLFALCCDSCRQPSLKRLSWSKTSKRFQTRRVFGRISLPAALAGKGTLYRQNLLRSLSLNGHCTVSRPVLGVVTSVI